MKERPILFSAPMVRAILAGTKTQTRRIVKPQWSPDVDEVSEMPALDPVLKCVVAGHSGVWEDEHGLDERRKCPYGQPGDRIWVKETCFPVHKWKHAPLFAAVASDWLYRADYDYREDNLDRASVIGCHKWTPSIHMPRAASRITLEIARVRVERLNNIVRGDAMAEGCPYPNMADGTDPRVWFGALWLRTYGPGSWSANPWVWVVEFRRLLPSSA